MEYHPSFIQPVAGQYHVILYIPCHLDDTRDTKPVVYRQWDKEAVRYKTGFTIEEARKIRKEFEAYKGYITKIIL